MSDIKDTASDDSDVSSNSSWTVLDETAVSIVNDNDDQAKPQSEETAFVVDKPTLFSEIEIISQEELSEEPQDVEASIESNTDIIKSLNEIEIHNENGESSSQNGCFTLDEYVEERKLIHDYEFDDKKSGLEYLIKKQTKKEKSKRKKCKAEQVGIIAVIGTVLAVAGVSLLCLLSPNSSSLTSTEIEKLKAEYNTTGVVQYNDTTPSFPVLYSKSENKFSVIDKKGVLEKCFNTNNASYSRQPEKFIKTNKKFENVPAFNLLKTDTLDTTTKSKCYGPITYKEYMEESEHRLQAFNNNKARSHEGKLQRITRMKSKGDLEVCSKFHKSKNVTTEQPNVNSLINGEGKPAPDVISSKLQKLKSKEVKLLSRKHAKSRSQPLSQTIVPAAENNTANDPKISNNNKSLINKIKTATIAIEKPQNMTKEDVKHAPDNLTFNGKIACDIVQDIMLLRMTSKAGNKLKNGEKKQSPPKTKKNSRIQKNNSHELKDIECKEVAKHKLYTKPSFKFINETKQLQSRKKGNTSSTTLKLLDELPFSQRDVTLETRMEEVGKNRTKRALHKIKVSFPEVILDEPASSNCIINSHEATHSAEIFSSGMNDFSKKQAKILEKLKQQQMERMEYLRMARERQEKSIKSFIKERQLEIEKFMDARFGKLQRFPVHVVEESDRLLRGVNSKECITSEEQQAETQKFKDAGCGNYHVPIPSASEINRRLLELSNKESANRCNFGFYGNSPSDDRIYRVSKRKGSDPNSYYGYAICSPSKRIDNCILKLQNTGGKPNNKESKHESLRKTETLTGIPSITLNNYSSSSSSNSVEMQMKHMKPPSKAKNTVRIPPEYIEMKRKYYERIGNYWRKREEYLEQRMNFMKQVSESVQEIMSNYRNTKNTLNTDSSSNDALTDLINQTAAVFPDDKKIQKLTQAIISDEASSSKITETSISNQFECNQTPIVQSCEYSPLTNNNAMFEFTADPYQLVNYTNDKLKDDTFYNWLFGKKGRQIRKRDLALWYFNKVYKRRHSKESNKREFLVSNKVKKPKKGI